MTAFNLGIPFVFLISLLFGIRIASGISFLRGMFNDLIGGTFNLKHFHGDRIWSVLCAVIAGTFFLVPVPKAQAQGTAAAVAAAAAVTSANTAYWSRKEEAFRSLSVVNHMGAIDLSRRRICVVPRGSYLKVNNCRKGDVIVIGEGTLYQIMEVCKLDEPVYSFRGDFACVYEDHEKKIYPAPDKKRSSF